MKLCGHLRLRGNVVMLDDLKEAGTELLIPRDAGLMALVRPTPEDPSGAFGRAMELLASIETSSSCNRIATTMLLASCRSAEGSDHDVDASLEDLRSVYAAQLAMCEIGSASSIKPQSCDSFSIMSEGKPNGVNTIRKDKLIDCLKSLESKPQWWTSYSNNKQNAGVICEATRIDIEKGKYYSYRAVPLLMFA